MARPSPAAGLVRFAIVLVLCWGLAAVVERVVDTYARQARQAEITRLLDEARTRFGNYEPGKAAGQSSGGEASPPVGGQPRS